MVKHIKSEGKWVWWFLLTYIYCVPGVVGRGGAVRLRLCLSTTESMGALWAPSGCSGFIEETRGFVGY